MTLNDLCQELAQIGAGLSIENDRLRYEGRLTPAMIDVIRAHKPQLLAMLRVVVASFRDDCGRPVSPSPQLALLLCYYQLARDAWAPDAIEMWEERAAIFEFDGGMGRSLAEALAMDAVRASALSASRARLAA